MPTSTWLGGALVVPTAVRMKPSTIRMRLKPVTVNSTAGTSVSPPISSRIWTALLEFRFNDGPSIRAGARPGRRTASPMRIGSATLLRGPRGDLAAGDRARTRGDDLGAERRIDQQTRLARLRLGVAMDRHDAVLGTAQQDVVAARPHEVHGATRAERERRDAREAGG